MWLAFTRWFTRRVLQIREVHWLERPSAFVKALRDKLNEDPNSSMRDIQIRSNVHDGVVKIKGEGIMNLVAGELEFDDVVYLEGKMTRDYFLFTLRCEAIYDGVIPSLTVRLLVDDRIFHAAVAAAAKFKQDLDRRHRKHSRAVV